MSICFDLVLSAEPINRFDCAFALYKHNLSNLCTNIATNAYISLVNFNVIFIVHSDRIDE